MASAWAYCRVSTRKEEQEDSLEAQRDRATAFAKEHSLELRVFAEQASAKSITGRPVISALLADLEKLTARTRPKYLFITAQDRLARDMVDAMYVGRILRNLKVTLYVYGRGEVHLDTFAQRAVFVGESMGGDAENEGRSKRMRDSWERRRREGKPTSNKVPYGLQLRGERDVSVDDSAEWVRYAFEWYAQGDGTHVIGKRMNGHAPTHTWLTTRVGDDGERVEKTRAGTKWEALRVTKLLRQRRYRDTIVEPELFDAVQRRLENTPKPGSRRKREYPLSGAMRCEGCGRHLHGRATGGSTTGYLADGTKKIYRREPTRYYACVVCDYAVNAVRLEDRFLEDVRNLVGDERLLRRWIDAPRLATSDVAALKREIKKLEAELENEVLVKRRDKLIDLVVSASLTEIDFKRQINRFEDDVASKRSKLAELRSRLETDVSTSRNSQRAALLLSTFQELYHGATYDQKRQLASTLAEALGGLSVSKVGLRWLRGSEVRTI